MKIKRRAAEDSSVSSFRQSVTIPARLVAEVKRVARERKVTMSRALVTLAEKGVEAEAAGRATVVAAHENFLAANESQRDEMGKELMQAIFGKDAVGEDPLR